MTRWFCVSVCWFGYHCGEGTFVSDDRIGYMTEKKFVNFDIHLDEIFIVTLALMYGWTLLRIPGYGLDKRISNITGQWNVL